MSAFVIITGQLFKKPEERTSKALKPYVTATMKRRDGNVLEWWNVVVYFSETAQAELLRLQDGDALTVQGALRIETYEHGGETRVKRTCFADQVLALRQPPKSRAKKTEGQAAQSDTRPRSARAASTSKPAFDDEVPF